MIPLNRVRTAAATDIPGIHRNFHGNNREKIHLDLLIARREVLKLIKNGDKKRGASQEWKDHIWKKSKDQLHIESNKKCAYCETPHRVISYGDVEHFRPKSKYWWLAYCYENYLPSCIACNQEYKKDKFPRKSRIPRLKAPNIRHNTTDAHLKKIASSITPDPITSFANGELGNFHATVAAEQSYLINPYEDNPNDFLAYEPILTTKEMWVIPNEANKTKEEKAKSKKVIRACEEVFGINRKELLDLRFQWFCFYMTFKHLESDGGLSQNNKIAVENRLKDLRSNGSSYVGMIKYFNEKDLNTIAWDPTLSIFNQ